MSTFQGSRLVLQSGGLDTATLSATGGPQRPSVAMRNSSSTDDEYIHDDEQSAGMNRRQFLSAPDLRYASPWVMFGCGIHAIFTSDDVETEFPTVTVDGIFRDTAKTSLHFGDALKALIKHGLPPNFESQSFNNILIEEWTKRHFEHNEIWTDHATRQLVRDVRNPTVSVAKQGIGQYGFLGALLAWYLCISPNMVAEKPIESPPLTRLEFFKKTAGLSCSWAVTFGTYLLVLSPDDDLTRMGMVTCFDS